MSQGLAQGLVADVAAEVARIRSLEFKADVPVTVVDDDEAERHVLERLERFDYEERLVALQAVYERLGLIPQGTDVLEVVLAAIREQAGGFYDPPTRSFFLLDDIPISLAEAVTAHELTHALEDQHFDLDGRIERSIEDDDLLFAHSAVHEGSAMLLMTTFAVERMVRGRGLLDDMQSLAGSPGLDLLPPVLLRQFVGPYVLGPSFLLGGDLLQLAEGYPARRIDGVYRDGPRSSEQVLHPEKYWDAEQWDAPLPVALPELGESLGRSWSRVAVGTLGELTLAVLAEPTPAEQPSSADEWTNAAAAGWGGDRWELWGRGARRVVVLATCWDTPADAREFSEVLPANGTLQWRHSEGAVYVVAGKLGAKRVARTLEFLDSSATCAAAAESIQ
ncbi:MAG: hypothetical protein GY716_00815 [bacterium]|nr:hypothetical protein [bacterium]